MTEAKERTPQEAFVEKLDFIARNKLERIILDTMSHPEQIPQDFFELRDTARQNGFSEIEEGFRLILEQIGETQSRTAIDRIRSKAERRRDEAALQQYLTEKPERLGLIEPGLTYSEQEKRIKSGRLDILANDGEGREVKIELKARGYDPRKSNFQIMKYFNDDETGEGRLIFVAPTIDAGLITSLAQYQKAGRMSFFEFKKQDGDYSFSEVKPEDIKEPAPIDWAKTKRTKSDEGNLVTVTSAAGKRASKSEEETELDSYPIYYRVLLLNRPNLRNKKRYLKPIFIERSQIETLEKLVSSPEVDRALDILERNLPWQTTTWNMDPKPEHKIPKELLWDLEIIGYRATGKLRKIIREGFNRSLDYSKDIVNVSLFELSRAPPRGGSNYHPPYEEVITEIANAQEKLHRLVNNMVYQDKIIARFRSLVKRTIKRDPVKRGSKWFELGKKWLFLSSCYAGDLLDKLLQSKVKRSRELAEIDEEIAVIYLSYNPLTYLAERVDVEEEDSSEKLLIVDNSVMIDFVKRDAELYKSILSNFRVREEYNQPAAVEQEPITLAAPQIREEKKSEPSAPTPYSLLRDSILHNHKEALDDDANARLDYFIEDVLQRGYDNEKLKQFGDSFLHFNLAKRIRRREDRPKDMQFRNFFDDVQLKYVMRGEVPNAQDLEYLYEEDCKRSF